MSEYVKPKKIWTTGFNLETTAGDINQKISIAVEELGVKSNVKGDRFFWIELEPTMRLMDEMAEAMSESIDLIDDSSKGIYECDSFTNQPLRLALEKYKQFKEGVK